MPQRLYNNGIGRDSPENRGLEFFFLVDGSYLPVKEALKNKYDGHDLMGKDSPAVVTAGPTLMVRFEVSNLVTFGDTLTFIDYIVAGIRTPGVPGESAWGTLPGES